ncbi:hypothetical protein [Acidicapsa acidisoli]|uniref:hypothetical protein n=1 Tax=Acidicapsa acidisoli TaxID=1615681 RepID=UPI0021E09FF1|nr:hypothetical protein [Acidicapsa acidisoli]
MARRQGLAVVVVGLAALLLRLAILPLCPIPVPFVPDDFSFLLAGDTFLHGRLTNPTPAMWIHFETIHITMQPTYMSMYFPAQGLVLAAGKLLFGHPWYGLLLTSALMCAAICWMLQAWLPPTWALLGGLIAVLHLSLFSYWINTYHAAGTIGALGGALVLGALPRLMKTAHQRYGVLMASGIAILVLTRPYEGLLLCMPVAIVMGHWAFFGKKRPAMGVLARRAVFPLALIVATVGWLGYYDYRAFGSPSTPPYTVDRATYAMAPYFVWQSQRPEPAYRHEVLRSFYYECELKFFRKIHTPAGFLPQTLIKALTVLMFFAGIALLTPLIMLRRAIMDRRIRFLVICMLVLTAGMLVQIFTIPHYVAPFTSAFYAIGLQAMRHLRLWSPESKPVGLALVRLSVTICVLMAGLRLFAGPLALALPEWPSYNWNFIWYGPDHFGTERVRVESELNQMPGKQLAIVRYASKHNPFEEWVYNSADIDGSKVIWARDMDASDNSELLRYYKDRQVWLVQPDITPATLLPYQAPELSNAVASVAH